MLFFPSSVCIHVLAYVFQSVCWPMCVRVCVRMRACVRACMQKDVLNDPYFPNPHALTHTVLLEVYLLGFRDSHKNILSSFWASPGFREDWF